MKRNPIQRASAVALTALLVVACGAEPAPAPSAPTESPAAARAPEPKLVHDAARETVETVPPPAARGSDAPGSAKAPVTATATATVTLKTVGTSPGKLVPKFTATGTTGGAAASLDSQAPGAVTVYCVGSTTCPYTNKYAAKLQSIESAYAGQAVTFVWLYPNRQESDAEKTAWHAEQKLGGLFVLDKDAAITKSLAAERTPEMVVTAADGTIAYRGAIDDGNGDPKRANVEYLRAAIDSTLAGQPVEVTETTPAG